MKLPRDLSLSAFVDASAPVTASGVEGSSPWGLHGTLLEEQKLMAPPAGPGPEQWEHPEVGWGVVLPDDDSVPKEDRAVGTDAPEPIRRLLAARPGSVVVRYRPERGFETYVRYLPDGKEQPLHAGVSVFGTGPGRLPRYLLIVGGPGQVPWKVQFALNRRHYVGRLALSDAGLDRYVTALLSDWGGASPSAAEAVVWSTTHDQMTRKMDLTIATQAERALGGDREIAVRRFTGSQATVSELGSVLADKRPGLVVTSSHGLTSPLEDADLMRPTLGLPVDQGLASLDPVVLLRAWDPSGAVWFAQACCSAGSNAGTAFEGLLPDDSLAHRVVTGVAGIGAGVAPLPTALLEADPPLAAFVGHVEPTFDWTLAVPGTGQHAVTQLVLGIYPELFRRKPVGLALAEYFRVVGSLYGALSAARDDVDLEVPGARERATYYKLTALDRESMVLLGDPTVRVPPLPSQR